jgi:hypothetical protein
MPSQRLRQWPSGHIEGALWSNGGLGSKVAWPRKGPQQARRRRSFVTIAATLTREPSTRQAARRTACRPTSGW